MTNAVNFSPAASVSFSAPAFAPGTFALPAYDAGNLDLMLTNNGCAAATITLSAGGGCYLRPGQSFMLTANASVLAAAVGHASVGNMSAAGSSATSCTAQTDQFGGTITVTRGTASAPAVF
jgi:hypothetical protein